MWKYKKGHMPGLKLLVTNNNVIMTQISYNNNKKNIKMSLNLFKLTPIA